MNNKADIIADLCVKHFMSLPKHGKPDSSRQWTIVAAFVQEDSDSGLKVVAVGTGTTCLGGNQLCGRGRIIHDSHAEIIARRALNRYLYDQIKKAFSSQHCIYSVSRSTGTCTLKSGVKFHFYTSQPPCGDASIFPSNMPLDATQRRKRKQSHSHSDGEPSKKYDRKYDVEVFSDIDGGDVSQLKHNDINRTGAKCAPGEKIDPHHDGEGYHQVGVLRTKPGRGFKTTSMSCSDKIMRWCIVGCQGALLSMLLNSPLYISTIVCGCKLSVDALRRAVADRVDGVRLKHILDRTQFQHNIPEIMTSNTSFKFSKTDLHDTKPCGSAIVWSNIESKPHDALAKNGFRLGFTMKNQHLPNAHSSICRVALFSDFMQIVALLPPQSPIKTQLNKINSKTYKSYKEISQYAKVWHAVRECLFPNWVQHDRQLDCFEHWL